MATAVVAGIAAFAYVGGGAVSLGAVAAGVAVAAATYAMTESMTPDEPGDSGQVQLGDQASSIDKTQMQQTAEIGKLELGESTKDKKKRKKGKAAFKIALDKEKAAGETGSSTGVQVQKPKNLGVQL